jgi:hypothetical protein
MRILRRCLAAGVAGLVLVAASANAQELEPRAYSASPVGANFAGLTYQRSWGSLVFDPSVPITDATADLDGMGLGYGRTFGLGKIPSLIVVSLPYIHGEFRGKVVGTDSSVVRSGPGDMRVKLSVNLVGGPALKPQDFARRTPSSVVGGVSLTVSAPTGQNSPDRLINLGANRWGLKPEAGASWNWRRKWYTDLYAGTWFFTENPEAYPAGTVRRQQDPLSSVQAHVSYTFARRSWAALDGTWFWGGESHTNGGPGTARQDNKRAGVTLAIGLTAQQSLKFGYSYGASTRVGDDFGTVGVAYQLLWF